MSTQAWAEDVVAALGAWEKRSASLYEGLAAALADALASRRIDPHLPSERALALALHVSRGTVARAYELLGERQVLDRIRGSGTIAAVAARTHVVCPDPLACVRAFFSDHARA